MTLPLVCPKCQRKSTTPDARFCYYCSAQLLNVITLDQEEITIGRVKGNNIVLEHPAVSDKHARLVKRNEQWYVVDESSAKGTFINYERVPHGKEGHPLDSSGENILWIAPFSFRLSKSGTQSANFEQAYLTLDACDLVRIVKNKGEKQKILDLTGVSLSFRPGEFIALVGGSGTGKSTLMKALLGLEPAQAGTVYINGRSYIQQGQSQRFEALNAIVGYVPQDDVLHYDLTPAEALDYVARIRLSPDLSKEDRYTHINNCPFAEKSSEKGN